MGSEPRHIRSTIVMVLLALLMVVGRWLFPERPADYVGPRALLDAGFALGLLGLTLLLAGGLGRKVQRYLGLEGLSCLEQAVFGIPIGLGILAYGVLLLGTVGLLRPWAILLCLGVASVWSWPTWAQIIGRLPGWLAQQTGILKKLRLGEKVLLVLGGLILVLTLFQALTPPWDYDGLMYHLPGPRRFLEAGRILLLPDTWQANGPFTVEMLFAVGLAFGSDTFAKLTHLAYAVCLLLATFGFGRRYLGCTKGSIAVALLLGVPIFPFWASMAYVDIAWALYEFLGMYALFLWRENGQSRWLVLAGLAMGWAMGCKYLALGGLGVLGLWVLWQSRGAGLKRMLLQGLLFGLPAALVGSPWYIKNWLWSGNPVYPLVFGGTGWNAERLGLLMAYLRSFGTGQRLVDYVLLPWNLYAQNAQFSPAGIGIEIPGLLVPLALLYPLTHRHGKTNGLAGMVALRFVAWALSSQQARFLLPLFPALSLLAAAVLGDLASHRRTRRRARLLLVILPTGATVLVTLFCQLFLLHLFSPLAVVLGRESKGVFLRARVADYPALQLVQSHLPLETRVLMMWDGRGYYCDARCLPDADQSNWTRLVLPAPDIPAVAARLQARGVTHLLLNISDMECLLGHDPTGQHRRAMEFFSQEFRPLCTREIYRDHRTVLFEITCQ
jgi:4-amino-4-deoxy-L-arabinose transferase-like glycosyltransferase